MNTHPLQPPGPGEPHCIFNQEGRTYLAKGRIETFTSLAQIPRTHGDGKAPVICMVPYAQIRERGFAAHDGGEKILCLLPDAYGECDLDQVAPPPGSQTIELTDGIRFNVEDAEFTAKVAAIIEDEIKNGEGSNFLFSRKCLCTIRDFDSAKAHTILRRFTENEFGSYLDFCFFDGSTYFIGSSPERHLTFRGETVEMNPICGTLPKGKSLARESLIEFLGDKKEINELFQVLDEELKMMARICREGGDIHGPFLKEMRTLIHTEYLLKGLSHIDKLEAFRLSMFAATMVGSPLENAARIIRKYEKESRRYYSSAILFLGRDAGNAEYLDSAITIRTMEVGPGGKVTIQSGASIVRDSVPEKECAEVKAKAEGLLRAITTDGREGPVLPKLMDGEIKALFQSRNENLSRFWLQKQAKSFQIENLRDRTVTILDNEDEFTQMLKHMFDHMGLKARVVAYDEHGPDPDTADLVLVGPGPGDPTDLSDPKMAKVHSLVDGFLKSRRKFLAVCLGHQIVCARLGFPVVKVDPPLQGVQMEIDLFGTRERVGFYNTFFAMSQGVPAPVRISAGEDGRINALRGDHFASFQFHLESVLTTNGFGILKEAVLGLL